MTSNSATAIPTQQSTKAYVDTHAADTTTHGATGAVMGTTNTQTASGKTLTTPVIASLYQDAGKTKLMTTPNTASDTLCAIAATQTLSGKTLTSPLFQGSLDGWISANATWTYASATTITIPAGGAAKYSVGDKIKLTANSVVLYAYIIVVADTLLTIKGNALTNHTFTLNYYSKATNPLLFPDWFAVAAPVFVVATYDDGAGGQPTTTECRFRISGRKCTIHYRGSGVKAGTNYYISVTSTSFIAAVNSTTHTPIGPSIAVVGTAINMGIISSSFATLMNADVTDNDVITNFAFTGVYEI